jgi:signal peptide peptidase SppA
MYSLSNAFKTFSPMLIEPAKAKAYLEKVANLSPTDLKAGNDIEDMMEMLFGPKPMMVKSGDLAVIPVKGVIGSGLTELEKMMGATDVEDIQEMLEDAERDPGIEVIIFDFDSPGGTVTGVPEMAERIRDCKKRTIGWTCKQSCSASMWLMSQCDEVYVSPSSMVGSIGVYIPIYDMTAAYAGEGVTVDLIKAGWAKGAGYPGVAMTPEQRKLFQDDVDEMHKWFIADVKAVRTFAAEPDMQGQCWSGKKGAEKSLVTGIMNTFDDLLVAIAPEEYAIYERAEKQVPSTGPAGYAQAADVSPEQGEKDEVEPISDGKKKKKKKKKPDGTESEEDEDGDKEEIPEDPSVEPIQTDQVKPKV